MLASYRWIRSRIMLIAVRLVHTSPIRRTSSFGAEPSSGALSTELVRTRTKHSDDRFDFELFEADPALRHLAIFTLMAVSELSLRQSRYCLTACRHGPGVLRYFAQVA